MGFLILSLHRRSCSHIATCATAHEQPVILAVQATKCNWAELTDIYLRLHLVYIEYLHDTI
jgi:hypothetical protein